MVEKPGVERIWKISWKSWKLNYGWKVWNKKWGKNEGVGGSEEERKSELEKDMGL